MWCVTDSEFTVCFCGILTWEIVHLFNWVSCVTPSRLCLYIVQLINKRSTSSESTIYKLLSNLWPHWNSSSCSFHPQWLQHYLLLSTVILPLQQKMIVGVGVQDEPNINDEVKTWAGPQPYPFIYCINISERQRQSFTDAAALMTCSHSTLSKQPFARDKQQIGHISCP